MELFPAQNDSQTKNGSRIQAAKRKVRDLMTKDVRVLAPESSVQDAAREMKKLNVGALPVCRGEEILGTLTDRDIVVRVVAQGLDVKTTSAEEAMTSPIVYCFDDQDIEEAARIMEVRQVRRLVVFNRQKALQGILSLGDLAVKTGREELSGEVLEKISEPLRPFPSQ